MTKAYCSSDRSRILLKDDPGAGGRVHSPSICFPPPSQLTSMEASRFQAIPQNAARLQYQRAVTSSLKDVVIPTFPTDRAPMSWRTLPPGYRSTVPAPPQPPLYDEAGNLKGCTPPTGARRPGAWDPWFLPQRFNHTSTVARPTMSRYPRLTEWEQQPSLQPFAQRHPTTSLKAGIDSADQGHASLSVSESGWKFGMRSVDNVQKRRQQAGHEFWTAPQRSQSTNGGPTWSRKLEAGGTGLRSAAPYQFGNKQPEAEPWLWSGKAPVKRTVGWLETCVLGHASHSHNKSQPRALSSISCL